MYVDNSLQQQPHPRDNATVKKAERVANGRKGGHDNNSLGRSNSIATTCEDRLSPTRCHRSKRATINNHFWRCLSTTATSTPDTAEARHGAKQCRRRRRQQQLQLTGFHQRQQQRQRQQQQQQQQHRHAPQPQVHPPSLCCLGRGILLLLHNHGKAKGKNNTKQQHPCFRNESWNETNIQKKLCPLFGHISEFYYFCYGRVLRAREEASIGLTGKRA